MKKLLSRPGWRASVGVAVALLALLGIYGFVVEPRRLTTIRVAISPQRWPPSLDGLSIAVAADLHVGAPYIDQAKVEEVVRRINAEHPDVVCLLGDYVIQGVAGGHFIEPEITAGILKQLHARWGVYAVLGNHDGWYDRSRVRAALEGAGIKVLENDAVEVQGPPASLWIGGLADLWTGAPNIPGTVAKMRPGSATILLTHNPDVFPNVPSGVNLVLAAHTHGGQVSLPILGRPIVPSKYGQRYAIGHILENGHDLFVTPGIGTSIIPVRFRVPPEITLLTLRASR